MRIRIHLEILNDAYVRQEYLSPIDALFDQKISLETINMAEKLMAQALERHTCKHKKFDGLSHWDGTNLIVGGAVN